MLCFQPAAQSFVQQTQGDVQQLEAGRAVEQEIKGGESHVYRIRLEAGQFLRVVVEQKGISIGIILAGPDGKQISRVSMGSGEESLSHEAALDGDHQITLRAVQCECTRGAYHLQAEVKAVPTAEDRKRIEAEQLVAAAFPSTGFGSDTAKMGLEKLNRALSLWGEMGDRQWEAYTLSRIGNYYLPLGQPEKGIEYYKQVLAIRRELKDRYGEANALAYLGGRYSALYQSEKAIEYGKQSLAMRRELKDRFGEASALLSFGSIYYGLGQYDIAIEYLEQALEISREVKSRADEAQALQSLSDAYQYFGRIDKAIEYQEQALTIRREVKDWNGEANALVFLATLYETIGQFDKELEYTEQMLLVYRKRKFRQGEAIALDNLSNVYISRGQYEKALDYAEQSLAIKRELKQRAGEAAALLNLQAIYLRMNRVEKADELREQARAIYRELDARYVEALGLNRVGYVYFDLEQYEKAAQYLEQARAIVHQLKAHNVEVYTLTKLGAAYDKLRQYEKAAECFEQARAIFRDGNIPQSEAETLSQLASVERNRGNLDQARKHIEQSIGISESIRAKYIFNPESRSSFFASAQKFYQFYADMLMQQHQTEPDKRLDALALEVNERARARGLLDTLAESRANIRQGVDAALLERERALARQLNDKAQRLVEDSDAEQLAVLKKEIGLLEADYERAQDAIRKNNPRYAALTQPQPITLAEIQQQLGSDTLLLEYSLGPERSYLWAIANSSLTSYTLPRGEQIEQDAKNLYDLLTARSRTVKGETPQQRQARIRQAEAKSSATAQKLSQTLLAPVAAQLGHKRLVIVADGALQYIPFAMLPKPGIRSQNKKLTAVDRPLMIEHEIISLPSASTLAALRKELVGRPLAPRMLAVIADPIFSGSDQRMKSAATHMVTQSTGASPVPLDFANARSIEHMVESGSGYERRLLIPRLPFTRQEAERILALTPGTANLKAVDFKANRATALSDELSKYRYLHFATHGLLDSQRPKLSALVLSLVDERGKKQDGFLRAHEIYNLNLPAELVVLSACQTGLGKEIKGEGLVGLTRGFMYAGAARVVVSLWSVNDRATAELMAKFYGKMLKENQPPAAALRAAQVEMWRQRHWQSPYYWAAFILQGEWK